MKKVGVECHAGYRANERPMRMTLGEQILEIVEVEDRWYSPGETYFRVRVEGLQPKTTYYYKVDSADARGRSDGVISGTKTFATP